MQNICSQNTGTSPNTVATNSSDTPDAIANDLKLHWGDIKGKKMIGYGNGANMYYGIVNKYSDTIGSVMLLSANGDVKIYDRATNSVTQSTGKTYTFTPISNTFITERTLNIKKRVGIYIALIAFSVIADIPSWSNVPIMQITDWDGGYMAFPAVSMQGNGEIYTQACEIEITSTGLVSIKTHGAISNKNWYFGNGVF